MTCLADANVLSEPTKPLPDAQVLAWLREHEAEIGGRKRTMLEDWFDAGVGRLHCVAWEAETGLELVQLLARLRAAGKAMPIKDSLIAATALTHGLIVATRNRSNFANAGVRTIDPFAG